MRGCLNRRRLTALAGALALAGCVPVTIDADLFLPLARPDATGAARQAFAAQTGQVEDVVFSLDGVGEVHVARLRRPGAEAIVLYHGGTGFRMANASRRAAGLSEAFTADVITFDYPQVGATTAPRDIPTFQALGPALFDRLAREGWIDDRPVYAYGFSFGGAMAANLAGQRPIAGLVIESSADDVIAVGANLAPGLARPFLRLRVDEAVTAFDYLGAAAAFDGPVLIFTGDADSIIPPEATRDFAQRLSATGASVRFASLRDLDHGEAFYSPAGFALVAEFAEASR